MDRFINFEQIRLIAVSAFSSLLAIITPTKGFVLALVAMFAFNIFAGMRADGISIVRCKNFKLSKFRGSLVELLLYLLIIETLQITLVECGDSDAALLVVKSLTYVFLYVYTCNAFRNLIIAYPKNAALRIVYHLIRLEFVRMLPEHWRPLIERYTKKDGEPEATDTTENTETPNT
jgi:hypothetical protein